MSPSVCYLPSSPTIMMVTPYKLIFNTALPFPNQIHSSLPHPSLWQWLIVAFTRLSPLQISLPIRLTTHIHTHRLFILLSLHLPQTPGISFPLSHPFSALHTTGFHFQILHPSLHHLVHSSPIFFSFCLSPSLYFMPLGSLCVPSFVVCFHIQYCHPSPCAFYTFWMTKEDRIRQRNDRGLIVSKGWVGLQYTRLPHEEAMWAFFCSLPREREWARERVSERERESVCRPPYNYDCVGRLFWYACGCFCMQALT